MESNNDLLRHNERLHFYKLGYTVNKLMKTVYNLDVTINTETEQCNIGQRTLTWQPYIDRHHGIRKYGSYSVLQIFNISYTMGLNRTVIRPVRPISNKPVYQHSSILIHNEVFILR